MQNIIRDIKLFINSEFIQEQKGGGVDIYKKKVVGWGVTSVDIFPILIKNGGGD